MTRQEHIVWCKERALELLDSGDTNGAMASMMSDMTKHDETIGAMDAMKPIAMVTMMSGNVNEIRKFIDGF